MKQSLIYTAGLFALGLLLALCGPAWAAPPSIDAALRSVAATAPATTTPPAITTCRDLSALPAVDAGLASAVWLIPWGPGPAIGT